MGNIASMAFLAANPTPVPGAAPVLQQMGSEADERAATLAKKAAQARARREKKRAGTVTTAKAEIKAARAGSGEMSPKTVAAVVARAKKPLPRPGEAGYKEVKRKTAPGEPGPKAAKATKAVKRVEAAKPAAVPKVKGPTGGAREGAGRKALYAGEVMKTVSFKVTEAQRKEWDAAGTGTWARAGLDERIAFRKANGTGNRLVRGAK